MMWEYFSWAGDDDAQHDYDVSGALCPRSRPQASARSRPAPQLAYTDDAGRVWEQKTHKVNKGITSNWRWWQPSLDEMKVEQNQTSHNQNLKNPKNRI